MPKKLNLQEVKRRSKEKGFIFLDNEYNGNRYKYNFRCLKHNEIYTATFKQIDSGSGLKCCGPENKIKGMSYSLDEVKRISLEKGFKFVDNFYNGCKYKHRFKCFEHNKIHTTRFDSIVEGKGLRCCLVASNRENNKKISKIMIGKNHPNWNYNLTDEERLYGRGHTGHIKWTKQVKKRDNYECQICGSKEKLHAHHLESWAKNKEIRCDINNGLTLCQCCHLSLHSLYGKFTTRKQFHEFKEKIWKQ